MQPIVDGLKQGYEDRIDFVYLNAADGGSGEKAFLFYKLRGHPSVVIISSDGTVLWSVTGVTSREDIEAAIRQALEP